MNNEIVINNVLVTCENKEGLVSNKNKEGGLIKGLPHNGFLGYLESLNSEINFISSGGTYKLLKSRGFRVIEISSYTNHPQMRDGLVSSIDYKVHASIMGQKVYKEDCDFLMMNDLVNIDCVITNFSPIDSTENMNELEIEEMRNKIDIGGPLLCMTSSKSFTNTLLVTDPKYYSSIIESITSSDNKCTLRLRLEMIKNSKYMYQKYIESIFEFYENIDNGRHNGKLHFN